MAKDLFGNEIITDVLLRDKFIEPPFSILDSKTKNWQNRKRNWIAKGIKSELGRSTTSGNNQWNDLTLNPRKAESTKKIATVGNTASIFDPALTELMYSWFCPENGKILDPFAGGSVRGIVANYLGYKYSGIELRTEQVESNREQAINILPIENQPQWYNGDSEKILSDNWNTKFDFIFSCPPYADLEVYSDLPEDLSNMSYTDFLVKYISIIRKSLELLKSGCYACFVVGDVRDKKGYYLDFISDTKKAFISNGGLLYNELILLNCVGSASMRAGTFMKAQKMVKIHQNVLVFKKP